MQEQTNSVKEIFRTASRQVAKEQRKVEKRIEKMRDVASKIKSLAIKWEQMLDDATTPVELKAKLSAPTVDAAPVEQATETEPKKKRGRPFKNAAPIVEEAKEVEADDSANPADVSEPVKARRGRPKKSAVESGNKTILRKKKK